MFHLAFLSWKCSKRKAQFSVHFLLHFCLGGRGGGGGGGGLSRGVGALGFRLHPFMKREPRKP